ncbi:MAG: hypothetical protein MK180_11100 [Rhodobacteraceae bacterium]|nr:hypothetical protein [Paracoccaceae bacterium]
MLDFIAAEAVQKSELVHILPQAVFPRHGIYLVHSENRRMRAMLMALQKDCSILCTGPTGEAA